ncbi:uncharacterized protein LOC131173065 [Hevea brasiliensis]|uniref:uncharacterized protein LOC131173065 n=1 Tax=Hevea brasiliensis TaxID=3981 RepID=UPI0025EB4FCF|nr:uncharacterized protein LOC131173065 [Hevea brasiliensis]
MGHISKVCKSKNKAFKSSQAQLADAAEVQEEQLFAVSCFSTNDPSDAWLINNGCTHHLCNNAEIFRILDDTYNSRVKVGNGKFLEVKGRGSMVVSIISELFYVKMNNKSFAVNLEKATEQACISASQLVTNLWHRRLGHVNHRSIAEMNKKGLVENMPEISCDAQEKQKDAHTPLYPKVQPQLAANELVNDLPVKGTRTLEDIYQRCTSRPDILFAVSLLSRFMHSPRETHLTAAKRVLSYIKGTSTLGIFFPASAGKTLKLVGYYDSDWGGCIEYSKSTSGYLFSLGSSFSWNSREQETTTQSIAEA